MKKNDMLFLSITCSIIIFAWIAFSVYHNSVTPTISETVAIEIIPITPTFNTEVITKLKQRQIVEPLYEQPQNNATASSLVNPPALFETTSPTKATTSSNIKPPKPTP